MIYIYIYLYIYIYIYIYIKVNYAITKIHEKATRSDLSAQIEKPFLCRINHYFFNVIYLYLLALLDFFFYFYFFSFFFLDVAANSAFSLCTLF